MPDEVTSTLPVAEQLPPADTVTVYVPGELTLMDGPLAPLIQLKLVNELGLDACIDYKAGSLNDELKAACPDGIDVYFDNVGGTILDACLARMNAFGRVSVCGLISQYNAAGADAISGLKNIRSVLINRLRMQGFIVSDRMELWKPALADLTAWYQAGKLKFRESVVHGLEQAPAALIGLLQGQNFGKQLVKLI